MNIEIKGRRDHQKASESYFDVIFRYPDHSEEWSGSVPIHYRRTGTRAETREEIVEVINKAYMAMNPDLRKKWLKEQDEFWNASNKDITRAFFDALKDSEWKCVQCQCPPNPNWARRVQDIKEFGYTLATNTKKFCKNCNKNTTQLILLRIPRGGTSGYEAWSPSLRKRIIDVLDHYDVYENRKVPQYSLLPDHKFPEIRWDENTREDNPDDMSNEEIKKKFQLLTNQRNQQKREVCRTCFQTDKRGTPFGIAFFYKSSLEWPKHIPKSGKASEAGCIGCGWYDMSLWRYKLNETIHGRI